MRTFRIQEIDQIDSGKVAIATNHAIAAAVADCSDRPGDKAPRKVTLELLLRPVLDKDLGAFDTISVQARFAVTIPKRQTAEYPMLVHGDWLMFEPESPLDPRQASIAWAEDKRADGDGAPPEAEPSGETDDGDDFTTI